MSDGVGGWSEYGFSSDQFSLNLMLNCKKAVEKRIVEFLDSHIESQKNRVTLGLPTTNPQSSK